jgi:hypothetical protein
VKISVITNGIVYRFFTDLVRENMQDDEPFLVFDCRTSTEPQLDVLEMFTPARFDVGVIREWADDHKNNQTVRTFLTRVISEPQSSPEFAKFVLDRTYDGVKSKSVVETFNQKLPALMKEALDGLIRDRLGLGQVPSTSVPSDGAPKSDSAAATTPEEMSAFAAVKGVIAGSGRDPSAVVFKDYPKWFNISHKRVGNWFIRLYFNDAPRVLLIRLPLARCVEILGSADGLEARGSGTAISMMQDQDVAVFAKAIGEAFDLCVSGRSHDGDSEDSESETNKAA